MTLIQRVANHPVARFAAKAFVVIFTLTAVTDAIMVFVSHHESYSRYWWTIEANNIWLIPVTLISFIVLGYVVRQYWWLTGLAFGIGVHLSMHFMN